MLTKIASPPTSYDDKQILRTRRVRKSDREGGGRTVPPLSFQLRILFQKIYQEQHSVSPVLLLLGFQLPLALPHGQQPRPAWK